jgi:hypothetical protein
MRTNLILFGWLVLTGVSLSAPKASLPRFTEEREAGALFFVKKHLPELLPLLTELKKNDAARYQQEICEVFQVTEKLADMQDEPKRHELELKIWKAENRAHLLVARLRAPPEEERKKLQEQLREVARELVGLDIQVLEAQAEEVDRELGEIKDELARTKDQLEQKIKARYEDLLNKAKKPRK